MRTSTFPAILIAIILLSGCVTAKQFDELQDNCEQIDKENTVLRLSSQDVEIEVVELRGQVETLTDAREELSADTSLTTTDRLGKHQPMKSIVFVN